MKKKQSKTSEIPDKRRTVVYIVIILWILMGVLTGVYDADFEKVAAYFLSMTAFVGAFIWAESVRKSEESSIFKNGPSSSREIMVYVILALWVVLGVFGVVSGNDMLSLAAYFAALSPFVSAFLLGQTYKPVDTATLRPVLRTRYDESPGKDENDYDSSDAENVESKDDAVESDDAEESGDGENAEEELNKVDKIKKKKEKNS